MRKIAVLGSRNWHDHEAVALLVNRLYEEHGQFMLVSGGGDIGTPNHMAEKTAAALGLPVLSLRPVKIGGDLTHVDEFGVEEWRLHRGRGDILRHSEPTFANFGSAATYRSWMIADRCAEGYVFWDGRSAGASFEIVLLKARDKLVEVIK